MNTGCHWYCYILKSQDPNYLNYTYNGSTNNIVKRLRQHNGEINGGAFRTRIRRPWQYIAILRGMPNHQNALSCEWRIRYPTGNRKKSTRFSGVKGRIIGLNEVLMLEKWTSKCKDDNKDMKLDLWILKEYSEYLDKNLPNNVTVYEVDTIDSEQLIQKA